MKIKTVLLSALATVTFSTASEAAVSIIVEQVGADVVFTASGTLNLTDLTTSGEENYTAGYGLLASNALIFINSPTNLVDYSGVSYSGSGFILSGESVWFSSSHSGDRFSIQSSYGGKLYLESGYTSGDSLYGTLTFANTTIIDMGLNPEEQLLSWGSGDNADYISFTVVPEPSTYAMIFGFSVFGLALWKRRSKKA